MSGTVLLDPHLNREVMAVADQSTLGNLWCGSVDMPRVSQHVWAGHGTSCHLI